MMPDVAPTMAGRLRSHGLRLTPQRRAVLEALEGNTDHPSALEIHRLAREHEPSVSLATVYNTLEVLKSVGAVLELPFEGCARYDPDVRPHVNVVCDGCGCIVDLADGDVPLAPLGRAVAAASGFALAEGQQLVYHGRCPGCGGEA
jgi:Fur family peroxide stress response transcriptional regulator